MTTDPRDEFDTADRLLWAARFKGLCCTLARVENDLGDQFRERKKLEVRVGELSHEHAKTLTLVGELRERVAVLEKASADLEKTNKRLVERLKERFKEIEAGK